MKRTMITMTIMVALLLLTAMASSSAADVELDKRHVKGVEIRPVTPRNGKNVALGIVVNPPAGAQLPKGITALVNDHQVHFYDDGRWPDDRSGDGIYTVAGVTKDGQSLKDKTTLRVQSSGLFEHHAVAPALKCTLKVVECPADCRSLIFHSRCVICLKLESCEIGLE